MAKKTLEEIEEQEVDMLVAETINDGDMKDVADFVSQIDAMFFPVVDEFDSVIFYMRGIRGIDLGTVATKAYRALHDEGTFYIDMTGSVDELDRIVMLVEYVGFKFIENKSNTLLVFEKVKEDEENK